MRRLVYDLLQPRTDAGVIVQVALVVVLLAVALHRTWTKPDLRLFTIGLGVFVLGLMVLRASH